MPNANFAWSDAPVALAVPAPELGEQVTNTLRRLIIAGEIPVDTHLVESSLSTMFNTSRGPVRDALTQLEREGLVESRKRGVYVLGITAADIEELYTLREAIECKVLELCVEKTDPDLTEPVRLLSTMNDAAERSDNSAFSHADLAFHTCFYKLAGNRRMTEVWSQYRPTYAVMMAVAEKEEVDLQPVQVSHTRILKFIEEKRKDDLLTEIRSHLLSSKDRIMKARFNL